jgi:PEP-CTERM motif-containing protein
MHKRTQLMIAAVAMAGFSSLANAGYITTTFNSGMTTNVAGATVVDFNSGAPAYYTGQGAVLTGSIAGQAAAPAGDSTPYLSVAYPLASGTETATLGSSYNYFGLYWGSIDDYNTLKFYSGNDLIRTITGTDVIASGATLGDQVSAGSNRYVNFFFHDLTFDKVVFSTTQYAFESDNHAYGRTSLPEPGTSALMGIGLAAMGLFTRRRRLLATTK